MVLLDILLLIMIVVCVGYCWMLNHRISDLQNSRVEFARMIKELNVSIVKAETNVNEMSQLSKITSTEIRSVVDEARESISELASLSAIAADVSSKLQHQMSHYGNDQRSSDNAYENVISAKSGERFSDSDLAEIDEGAEESFSYTNNLKNFIQNIAKKPEDTQVLNQTGYYDTLRKINAKK